MKKQKPPPIELTPEQKRFKLEAQIKLLNEQLSKAINPKRVWPIKGKIKKVQKELAEVIELIESERESLISEI